MVTTPCPRCGVELAERRSGRATLLACGDCGGVWLDPESARKVLEHRQGVLAQVVISERVAASARVDVDEAKAIRCPFDAEPLARVTADGVDVDTCRVHGTWFDAGEVRRIANAFTTPPEARPSVSRPESSSNPSSGDYIGGFLGALFVALDEVD